MNQTVPLKTDIRALLPLWSIIMIAGVLQMPRNFGPGIELVAGLVFTLGLPILALLPLGVEFHYGTFPQLLAQPIDRNRIWKQKTFIAVAAVVTASIPYALAGLQREAVAWAIVSACSATFWTVRARSLIGAISGVFLQAAGFIVLLFGYHALFRVPYQRPQGFVTAVIAYSALTLWLGHKRLLQFQATDSVASNTLVVSRPALLDRILPRMLPVRRSGAMLNMVCKELNLLWHVIPLTLIALTLLIGLTLLRYVADSQGLLSLWPQYGVGVVIVYGAMVCIFAGLVPVGLERESGTHSWNLILPVSTRRQWAVKLLTAIVVTLVCFALFSLLAAFLLGPAFMAFVGSGGEAFVPWLIGLAVACVVFFWCATASRGLMQAMLWLIAFPPAIGLSFAGGRYLVRFAGELMAGEPSWWTAYLLQDATRFWISNYSSSIVFQLALLSPALLVMMDQTYRLFRQEIRKPSQGARSLVTIGVSVFVAAFVIGAPEVVSGNANRTASTIFAETAQAVKINGVDLEKLKEDGKLEISAGDLKRTATAERWLGNSTVVLATAKPASAENLLPRHSANYFITVRVWNKVECSFDEHPIHGAFYSCVSIPGVQGN